MANHFVLLYYSNAVVIWTRGPRQKNITSFHIDSLCNRITSHANLNKCFSTVRKFCWKNVFHVCDMSKVYARCVHACAQPWHSRFYVKSIFHAFHTAVKFSFLIRTTFVRFRAKRFQHSSELKGFLWVSAFVDNMLLFVRKCFHTVHNCKIFCCVRMHTNFPRF